MIISQLVAVLLGLYLLGGTGVFLLGDRLIANSRKILHARMVPSNRLALALLWPVFASIFCLAAGISLAVGAFFLVVLVIVLVCVAMAGLFRALEKTDEEDSETEALLAGNP